MALVRWEPVTELNTIQNEMNRLFNNFFDAPGARGSSGPQARRWLPAMDLVETKGQYVLRADLPGLSDEDVNVQLEDSVLTISGERKIEQHSEQEGYYRLERAFGGFSRSLTLPDGIDPGSIQAHFDRGVLEITIPKPEQKRPHQVQIKLDGGKGPETFEDAAGKDPNRNSRDPETTIA